MQKVYEVILKGFDGGTDATDHLILWVWTESKKNLLDCVEPFKSQVEKINLIYDHYVDGVDYNLPFEYDSLREHLEKLIKENS